MREYEIFISHASEDKDAIARPLAEALRTRGYHVWFDDFCIRLGDSISRRIEDGLKACSHGVLVCSHAYFTKPSWCKVEMETLLSQRVAGKILIPIVHEMTFESLRGYSPVLGNIHGLNSAIGIDLIADEVIAAIRGRQAEPARKSQLASGFGQIGRRYCLVTSPIIGDIIFRPATWSGNDYDWGNGQWVFDSQASPFVVPGSLVRPDSVLCLIGAMALTNEINALISGRFARFLVKDGDPVEYEQPIAEIDILDQVESKPCSAESTR